MSGNMDMLKKLKSVFIVEDTTTSTTTNDSDDSTIASGGNSKSTSKVEESMVGEIQLENMPTDGSAPDTKFVEILLKAIEDNNLQGFDYLEYKSSLQSLAKMNMDDTTKYQSAMAMAKTMGATKDKIIQSANHYLSILSKENEKFQTAVQAQKSKITQDQQSGLKTIEVAIENKKKQIEQLTKEIEMESKKLEDLKSNINANTIKISETTSKFNYAYKIVSEQIAEDMKNITSYITSE